MDPFNISCGRCDMCDQGLQSQCETTHVHEFECGASLFGYPKLYGQVPGGQFDKQIQNRMGQANVRRWVDEILPVLGADGDELGVEQFATHRVPLDAAPDAYARFQARDAGTVNVLFQP